MTTLNEILGYVIAVLILLVTVLDIAALIATPFLSRRADEEQEQILVGLLPLEMIILFIGPPFWCVALLVLFGP